MIKFIVAVILDIIRLLTILILFMIILEAITHAIFIRNILGASCHQIPERCFSISGKPIAVCARCLGIYLGIVFGKFYFPRFRWLFWLMLSISVPEIAMKLIGIDSPNFIRFLSGYCFTTAIYLALSRFSWELPKHAISETTLKHF
ncbi:hypothetical protein ES703_114060 [subsurface metagenome]